MAEPATRRPLPLAPGDPAPWFTCPTAARSEFAFSTVAGRYIVLAFLGPGAHAGSPLLGVVRGQRAVFDDERFSFFGVCGSRAQAKSPEFADSIPGIRFFRDFDGEVSALYGAAPRKGAFRPLTYVLDPALRVIATLPNDDDPVHAARLFSLLERLPPLASPASAVPQAPVLVLPRIFEPELCARLVAYYDRLGGEDLGFAKEVGGMTARVIDHGHKRRGDRVMEDAELCRECRVRIRDRVVPMVRRAFLVRPTRMERYLVSCYEPGGHFRPHRDNTTKGTAHRQFAVSLFLNEDYEGGELQFPEFGRALFRAPVGGAVVFSCSLLHTALPVTAGRRMMFLPFLYDEAGARTREENLVFLDDTLTAARR